MQSQEDNMNNIKISFVNIFLGLMLVLMFQGCMTNIKTDPSDLPPDMQWKASIIEAGNKIDSNNFDKGLGEYFHRAMSKDTRKEAIKVILPVFNRWNLIRYLDITQKLIMELSQIPNVPFPTKENINEASEAEQIVIIQNLDITLFEHIKNPTEAVQLAAVKIDAQLIRHIKNPSEAVQLKAVRGHLYAIRYIKTPTKTVKIEAEARRIRSMKSAILSKTNLWPELTLGVRNPTEWHEISEAAQLLAVEYKPEYIEYIKNPTEAVQLVAVKQFGLTIKYIKNPTEAVQLLALKKDGTYLKYIKKPTKAVQLWAVKQGGRYIEYIKKPHRSVRNHPNVIAYKKCKNDKVYSYSGSVGRFAQGGTIRRDCSGL